MREAVLYFGILRQCGRVNVQQHQVAVGSVIALQRQAPLAGIRKVNKTLGGQTGRPVRPRRQTRLPLGASYNMKKLGHPQGFSRFRAFASSGRLRKLRRSLAPALL